MRNNNISQCLPHSLGLGAVSAPTTALPSLLHGYRWTWSRAQRVPVPPNRQRTPSHDAAAAGAGIRDLGGHAHRNFSKSTAPLRLNHIKVVASVFTTCLWFFLCWNFVYFSNSRWVIKPTARQNVFILFALVSLIQFFSAERMSYLHYKKYIMFTFFVLVCFRVKFTYGLRFVCINKSLWTKNVKAACVFNWSVILLSNMGLLMWISSLWEVQNVVLEEKNSKQVVISFYRIFSTSNGFSYQENQFLFEFLLHTQ